MTHDPYADPNRQFAPTPPSAASMQPAGSAASLQPLALPPGNGQTVMVGDIAFTPNGISSPQGRIPLAGAEVFVTNMTHSVSRTPTWAIVVAIIGAWFLLLSLLLLLVKETRVEGGYEIRVTSPNGQQLWCNVPVSSATAGWIWNDLQQRAVAARNLVATAR